MNTITINTQVTNLIIMKLKMSVLFDTCNGDSL